MAKLDIDKITPSRSLIDFTGFSTNSLDSTLLGYDLCEVLDDIVLTEFVDTGSTNNEIVRNGLVVPINAQSNAWRIGKVILAGKGCKLVKKGDFICFPNNMGVNISKLRVVDYGQIESGQFLNEHRIFGVVKPSPEQDANNTTKSRRNTKK
jgi:hypothetical protein